MKFVLAPDSFKESLDAIEVANAMEEGLSRIFPDAEYVKIPMADGGEGTTRSLVDATNGSMHKCIVTDPIGRPIEASFGILGNGKVGILEMASASGLELIDKSQRNPMITTTFGTGELIKNMIDHGVEEIIIGIGGSATNDGGAGMIQALGGKLLDKNGDQIGFGGGSLSDLDKIDLDDMDPRIKDIKILVACDVTNTLTGEFGATAVFGPQKGADEEMLLILERNLNHFAEVIEKDLGISVLGMEGGGAAGGLGAGLVAFLNGKLEKGIDIVIKYTNIEEKIIGADYVFTGEGSIDSQTRFGKTPYGVAKLASKQSIPVIAVAGNIEGDIDILYDYGFNAIFCILQNITSLENAIKSGSENIKKTCENIGRLLKI